MPANISPLIASRVLPRPLQQPHPPVWMAATSEPAIDWAASRGFSILMDPHCTNVELGDKRRRYGEQMAATGFSAAGRDIPMARLIAVAETAEQAAEVARRGAGWTVGSYIGGGRGDVDPVDRYVNEVILHGTPESVLDQILALRETASLNYLLCAPLSQLSFNLITERILPKLDLNRPGAGLADRGDPLRVHTAAQTPRCGARRPPSVLSRTGRRRRGAARGRGGGAARLGLGQRGAAHPVHPADPVPDVLDHQAVHLRRGAGRLPRSLGARPRRRGDAAEPGASAAAGC